MAIEIPDEYGLSSDSLRGSHQFVRADLVDSQDSKDPLTARPNPRAKLSTNEILALENAGILVDENGYEREPEPIESIAPVPIIPPRVRGKDAAPASVTQPTPPVEVPVDESERVNPLPTDNPSIPPYGGTQTATPVTPNPSAVPPYGGNPSPNSPAQPSTETN